MKPNPEMDAQSHGHQAVMLEEVVDALKPVPGATMIDCTAGRGGHATALARKLAPDGQAPTPLRPGIP